MLRPAILQNEVSQNSHLKDRSNHILEGKKNGPVVLPDMILHCFGAASNIVSNVIGVF
jgi:hypothetical protein